MDKMKIKRKKYLRIKEKFNNSKNKKKLVKN